MAMTRIEKEFMSLEDVAELMGVNYQLIYKLVRSGELPAARLGKVYRIQRRDLESFLEKTKTDAARLVCAACGTAYRSRGSVRQHCVECGAPLCDDCWTRRKVRRCAEHEASAAAARDEETKRR